MIEDIISAGNDPLAMSSIDAMRSEASTSLRGGRAGVDPFFPFGILDSWYLHRGVTVVLCSAGVS